ncbi:hypothetical protein Tco_1068304 [Tanacetum coccineum]|uniref:Uncharacterized protein n=1 Tax=Tanacetum coccineum TaxID=301880 RepID=A0ABQ5HH95_9ASTR
MSQDVMICVINSIAVFDNMNVEMQSSESCVKCVDLDVELLNKHCISLELTMQLNQEIFQKDSLTNNQNALEVLEYFENNNLKAHLQAKDTTILKWKPTGRLFTIVSNSCPLTRITPKKIMHLKETTSISVETSKPEINVYKPTHLWGSNAIDVPFLLLLSMTGCLDCSLVSGLRMLKTYDRESISAHELRQ